MSNLSADEQVKARAQAARRLSRLYECEANGLFWSTANERGLTWLEGPDEQAAFDRGFREGREIYRTYQASAEPPVMAEQGY